MFVQSGIFLSEVAEEAIQSCFTALSVITFVVPASGAGAATTFHCWQSPASPSDLAENRGRNVAMRTGRVPITNGEWQHTFNLPAVKLHSSRSSGELITFATKAR